MKVIHDWRWSFRLLPTALDELRIRPMGVIHVGAHRGEEVPIYLECGFPWVTLVEPDPENCAALAGSAWINNPAIGIVNAACGREEGRATFHRAESTAFSGLRQDMRQTEAASFPVRVVLTYAVQQEFPGNVLVVDTQGTELDALASAEVGSLDLIIVETQTEAPDAPGAYWPKLMQWCRTVGWMPRIQWKRDDRWSDLLLTPARHAEVAPQ